MFRIVAFGLFGLFVHFQSPAHAQTGPRVEQIRFAPGTSGTVIEDRIEGYEVVRYVLGASAGQRMTVSLRTDHNATYFNVVQPSAPNGPALAVSEQSATNPMVPDINRFDGILPESGSYVIEVYMYRSAARRGEVADFTLDIAIRGEAAPGPDFADGLMGGPDYWAVNVQTALNMRAEPSAAAAAIARLPAGLIVANRGCRMAEGRRWCQVVSGDMTGWVAGDFLVESAAPAGAVAYGQGDATNAQGFNATGRIPCATGVGAPMTQCEFGVIRRGGGDATVVVTRPDGSQRYLYFEGNASSSDGCPTVWERDGDLNKITVGGVERYEVPDAVRFGG